jgi:DNA (cytosine-5)-methyltransferase 1
MNPTTRRTRLGPVHAVASPPPHPDTPTPLVIPVSPGPVIGSLCTGYGGLDLGVLAALGGGRIAWCADPDPHIATILTARLPGVPNLGDLRTVDWAHVEPVDVVTAGFPCQDISAAGNRAGIEKGTRSGLWTDIMAALRLLRPALVIVENVAALRWRHGGLHRVLGALAEAGYDAAWRSVRAADIGAPHRRERVFLLAWPHQRTRAGDAGDAVRARRQLQRGQRSQQTGRPVVAGPASATADPDRSRLTVGCHPDCPQTRAANTGRVRDADRLDPAAPHTDRIGRQELHASRPDRRSVTAGSGPATTDPACLRQWHGRSTSRRGVPATTVPAGAATGGPQDAATNTPSHRWDQGLPSAARLQGRPDAAIGDHSTASQQHGGRRRVANNDHLPETGSARAQGPHPDVDWGSYAPAVRRWEHLLGRPAPYPTQRGRHGRPVLAPAFVEHLMGLPAGWITDLPLPRTAQLRALGNGVVPQQAAHAVALLLTDLALLTNEDDGNGREANAA